MGHDIEGVIANSAKLLGVTMPERGPFYDEVHDLVRRIKVEHKSQRIIFAAWCLLITVMLPVCFVWLMLAPSLMSGMLAAVAFELYFLNIFHTRHHKGGKLYGIVLLDRVTAPFYEFVDSTWGYVPSAWWRNHHVMHHMHTNELGDYQDTDLPSTYPLIRMFKEQPRLWFHTFQTFYWPVLLLPSVARFPVSNLLEHRGNPGYFIVWVMFMFVLPYTLHGKLGLLCSGVTNVVTGISITYKFAVSHAHPDFLEADGSTQKSKTIAKQNVDEWMKRQVCESTSWGGYWSCLIFGGINMQIEHHLVPALDPPLYAILAPELKRICKKHNVRYTSEPSFFHSLEKFHRRLWIMG